MVTTKAFGVLQATPKKIPVKVSQPLEQQQVGLDRSPVMPMAKQNEPLESMMLRQDECSRVHGHVNTIAGSAPSLASEQDPTNSTAAMSTDIDVEKQPSGSDLLKGFRKRWRDRISEGSDGTPSLFGGSQFDLEQHDELDADFIPKKTKANSAALPKLSVEDAFDLEDETVEPSRDSVVHASLPKHGSDAARATNLNVFKYPWESGRLAKIFSNDDPFKLSAPSLQPGGRNFISMCLEVSQGASAVAKVKVQGGSTGESIFQSVVKKSDDISVQQNKKKQRCAAIEGWWKLLSSDPTANSIGLRALEEVSCTA